MSADATRRVARPRRPVPKIDPAIERLSEMLLALLSQVTVMRERLDTVERLIEKARLFGQKDIEHFVPDGAAEAARTVIRKRQIDKVMRPLLDATRRAASPATPEEPT